MRNGRSRWKIQLLTWITSLDKESPERNFRSGARRDSSLSFSCPLSLSSAAERVNQSQLPPADETFHLKFIIDKPSNTSLLERKVISISYRGQERNQSFRHLLHGSSKGESFITAVRETKRKNNEISITTRWCYKEKKETYADDRTSNIQIIHKV